MDFAGFCLEKRLAVDLTERTFPLLHKLLNEEASFRNELIIRKREKAQAYQGLSPRHKKRKVKADQLTNLDYTGFCPEKRMAVDLSALAFPLLHELLDEEASFRNELATRKREKAQEYQGPSPLHKKRKTKAPW
jgi:hypothetical protein